MGLFSKLKDYNLELEEILDRKYFSSSIKNLLFSMIYKIEISYVDYLQVKKCVRTKDDFLNELIETIRLYCDNVKTVEPDSDQAKMLIKNSVKALTNEKERSILAYPTEIALLYALSEISPKYFYMNQEFSLKKQFQNVLVNGYVQNNMEILSDFTGWSWDKTFNKKYAYIDNLIYQNLLVILGEKFLYEWRTYGSTRRDFLEEAKKYIKYFTGNEKYLISLYKLIYLNSSNKEKEKITLKLREDIKLLKKMNDKPKYIEEIKAKKQKFEKRIRKFDIVLEEPELLEKEFIKANSKLDESKRIKSLKRYKQLIEKEREKIVKEIEEIDYILKPENFSKKKEFLKKSYEIYTSKQTLDEVTIENQKYFLNFVDKRLNKMKTRDEILDVLYELRYYKSLRVSKGKLIVEIEEIDNEVDKIMKKAITMLCKLGAIRIISMDINLNFEIIKYALDTKIMELEKIKLYFDQDENGLIIKVFDKDIIEKQGRKRVDISKKTLEVKLKRKIKLFS
ncbi:MAG: hypothetical protein IJW20_04945 [Clostridia bacterium]|nr:hypothetical protein [Clostridia bacterium]